VEPTSPIHARGHRRDRRLGHPACAPGEEEQDADEGFDAQPRPRRDAREGQSEIQKLDGQRGEKERRSAASLLSALIFVDRPCHPGYPYLAPRDGRPTSADGQHVRRSRRYVGTVPPSFERRRGEPCVAWSPDGAAQADWPTSRARTGVQQAAQKTLQRDPDAERRTRDGQKKQTQDHTIEQTGIPRSRAAPVGGEIMHVPRCGEAGGQRDRQPQRVRGASEPARERERRRRARSPVRGRATAREARPTATLSRPP
jgi:hypothetical protein